MSTTAPSLATREAALNTMILAGKIFEAFDEFYADDVLMQENSQPATVGRPANVEREKQFFSTIETFHGATLHGTATGDDVTFSEWTFDATYKGIGRVAKRQVAIRRWRDGRIVEERFVYDTAS